MSSALVTIFTICHTAQHTFTNPYKRRILQLKQTWKYIQPTGPLYYPQFYEHRCCRTHRHNYIHTHPTYYQIFQIHKNTHIFGSTIWRFRVNFFHSWWKKTTQYKKIVRLFVRPTAHLIYASPFDFLCLFTSLSGSAICVLCTWFCWLLFYWYEIKYTIRTKIYTHYRVLVSINTCNLFVHVQRM